MKKLIFILLGVIFTCGAAYAHPPKLGEKITPEMAAYARGTVDRLKQTYNNIEATIVHMQSQGADTSQLNTILIRAGLDVQAAEQDLATINTVLAVQQPQTQTVPTVITVNNPEEANKIKELEANAKMKQVEEDSYLARKLQKEFDLLKSQKDGKTLEKDVLQLLNASKAVRYYTDDGSKCSIDQPILDETGKKLSPWAQDALRSTQQLHALQVRNKATGEFIQDPEIVQTTLAILDEAEAGYNEKLATYMGLETERRRANIDRHEFFSNPKDKAAANRHYDGTTRAITALSGDTQAMEGQVVAADTFANQVFTAAGIGGNSQPRNLPLQGADLSWTEYFRMLMGKVAY